MHKTKFLVSLKFFGQRGGGGKENDNSNKSQVWKKERMFYHDEYYLCFPSQIASYVNFRIFILFFKEIASCFCSGEFTFPRVVS